MKRTTLTLTDEHERALQELSRPGPLRDPARAWAAERGIELSDSPAVARYGFSVRPAALRRGGSSARNPSRSAVRT